MRRQPSWIKIGLLAGDLLITNFAFIASYFIRFRLFPVWKGVPPFSQYLRFLPLISIILPLIFLYQGLYKPRRERTKIADIFGIAIGVIASVVIMLGLLLYYRIYYQYQPEVAPRYEISQLVLAIFLVLDIPLLYLFRRAVRRHLEEAWRKGLYLQRVVIAGAGDLGRALADRILVHDELGLKVIGFLDDDPKKQATSYHNIPVLGELAKFSQLVKKHQIDKLYVALPLRAHEKTLTLIKEAYKEGIDVYLIPDLLEFIALKAEMEELGGLPVINLCSIPLGGWKSLIKRAMDIVIAIFGLIIMLVLLPLIAIAIKIDSEGPVFYKQKRMGLDGRVFTLYKFRSMYKDAERETGPVWAKENDPRCTRVGRFLRRYSLDELPQFYNVLKGDMSVVGPRPERPEFVTDFKERIPQYMLRHKVKSGITGWAQVNGWRGNTSLKKRIEHDIYYIENWSLSFDLKIIWLTFLHLFRHRNAY